jgi:hypothetical protein
MEQGNKRRVSSVWSGSKRSDELVDNSEEYIGCPIHPRASSTVPSHPELAIDSPPLHTHSTRTSLNRLPNHNLRPVRRRHQTLRPTGRRDHTSSSQTKEGFRLADQKRTGLTLKGTRMVFGRQANPLARRLGYGQTGLRVYR